jgi:hypothetical protein
MDFKDYDDYVKKYSSPPTESVGFSEKPESIDRSTRYLYVLVRSHNSIRCDANLGTQKAEAE